MTLDNHSRAEEQSGLHNIDPDLNFTSNSTSMYFSDESFNQLMVSQNFSTSKISTLFLNIRSAPKNLEAFQDYLNLLNFQFSVIGLAETWLNTENQSLYSIPNYSYYGKVRNDRAGGGVALLIHHDFSFRPRNDLDVIDENIECVFGEVSPISGRKCKYVVGAIYRPPNTCCGDFLNKLDRILYNIHSQNTVCYLMGDFNLNLIYFATHQPTNLFLLSLYASSFHPCIDKPTRITINSSTLIDNIFSNSCHNNLISGILYCDISDHLPIFTIEKTTPGFQSADATFQYRRFNSESINSFRESLGQSSWDRVYSSTNSENAYFIFFEQFLSLYNNAFPLITKTKRRRPHHKPWISPAIKKSISKRNALYKKYHTLPTLSNELRYRNYKKSLSVIIKAAKKVYYNAILHEHKSNIKETWRIMKEIIGAPNKPSVSSSFITDDGTELTDSMDIANGLNNYFVSIGQELASNIPSNDGNHLNYLRGDYTESIFFAPVVENEIMQCISKLKKGSAGHDQIKPSIIKSCGEFIASPLTYIFNLSINEGHVPSLLKYAYITPVFKSGEANKFNNYRPISVLPCFSKILERIIFNRLYTYLENKNILSDCQFGFRKSLNTEMALITAIDFITRALDSKEHVLGLFLDLRKAFDTVDTTILLSKLHYYGIRGTALAWFNSYLSDRTQSVKFNNVISQQSSINMGVPQGSILGPLLFILYINDITSSLSQAKPILFADDTTLFLSGSNISMVADALNQEISSLGHWFACNRLSLNIGKTQYILFTNSSNIRSREIKISVDGQPLNRVSETKFLGVIIDENLNWTPHINHISSKLRRNIGILKKTSAILNTTTLITLYYSFIYPYILYCHLIWGKSSSTNNNRILILQKRALRIIYKQSFLAHTDILFRESKIIKVTELFNYLTSIFIYKFINGLYKDMFIRQLSNSIKFINSHRLYTRSNTCQVCSIPSYRTNLRLNTVVIQCHKIFNNFFVPMQLLLHSNSLYVFRKNIRSLYI